jgi:hypothetical protein
MTRKIRNIARANLAGKAYEKLSFTEDVATYLAKKPWEQVKKAPLVVLRLRVRDGQFYLHHADV